MPKRLINADGTEWNCAYNAFILALFNLAKEGKLNTNEKAKRLILDICEHVTVVPPIRNRDWPGFLDYLNRQSTAEQQTKMQQAFTQVFRNHSIAIIRRDLPYFKQLTLPSFLDEFETYAFNLTRSNREAQVREGDIYTHQFIKAKFQEYLGRLNALTPVQKQDLRSLQGAIENFKSELGRWWISHGCEQFLSAQQQSGQLAGDIELSHLAHEFDLDLIIHRQGHPVVDLPVSGKISREFSGRLSPKKINTLSSVNVGILEGGEDESDPRRYTFQILDENQIDAKLKALDANSAEPFSQAEKDELKREWEKVARQRRHAIEVQNDAAHYMAWVEGEWLARELEIQGRPQPKSPRRGVEQPQPVQNQQPEANRQNPPASVTRNDSSVSLSSPNKVDENTLKEFQQQSKLGAVADQRRLQLLNKIEMRVNDDGHSVFSTKNEEAFEEMIKLKAEFLTKNNLPKTVSVHSENQMLAKKLVELCQANGLTVVPPANAPAPTPANNLAQGLQHPGVTGIPRARSKF